MARRDRIWKSKNATDLFEDQVPQFLPQISDLTQPFVTQHCLAGFVMQLSRRSSRYIFTYFIPRFLSNQQSSIIASHFQKYSSANTPWLVTGYGKYGLIFCTWRIWVMEKFDCKDGDAMANKEAKAGDIRICVGDAQTRVPRPGRLPCLALFFVFWLLQRVIMLWWTRKQRQGT